MEPNEIIKMLNYENNYEKYIEYCEQTLGEGTDYASLPPTQVLSILKTEGLLYELVESFDFPYPVFQVFRSTPEQLALWQKYVHSKQPAYLLPPGTSKHF